MNILRFIPKAPKVATLEGSGMDITEIWSCEVPQIYEVATDSWSDVDVIAGVTQGMGEVVQLLGRQFTLVETQQLRNVLDAALSLLWPCADPNCRDHQADL